MLKTFIFLTFIYSFVSANDYLTAIKQQSSITYKTLVDTYFYYLDELLEIKEKKVVKF